ncbi:hypothetical protein ABNX05_10120 [Lysinibacillus sp. M3]|uniref:Uncharacterized protein n=1 Tax=Lysinibacillus zambalensis TaxID=3160866 RepID=A0ABV1MR34_9BACI
MSKRGDRGWPPGRAGWRVCLSERVGWFFGGFGGSIHDFDRSIHALAVLSTLWRFYPRFGGSIHDFGFSSVASAFLSVASAFLSVASALLSVASAFLSVASALLSVASALLPAALTLRSAAQPFAFQNKKARIPFY